MKRKFLIWSALLTVVFGAALLQSCSADDDSFATEEYGYYTDEEIEAIMALGKKYGVCINVDETTYEVKKTLEEFEEDIKMHMALLGEYELVPIKGGGNGEFLARKKENNCARTITRAAESGSWSSSFSNGNYKFSIKIDWKYPSSTNELGVATGEFKATRNFIDHYGSLRCYMGMPGTDTVTFSGQINIGSYTFYITQGFFSISTYAGSYYFEKTLYQEPPHNQPPTLKPAQE